MYLRISEVFLCGNHRRGYFSGKFGSELLPISNHPHVVQLLIDSATNRLCALRESLHYIYTRACSWVAFGTKFAD